MTSSEPSPGSPQCRPHPIELAVLRQLAKKLSGIGLRGNRRRAESEREQQAAQNAEAARARQAARRQDPRPLHHGAFPDEPWLPQMDVLNEVIGGVIAARPPARDIDGDAMQMRKLPVPNMHAFIDANQEGEDE